MEVTPAMFKKSFREIFKFLVERKGNYIRSCSWKGKSAKESPHGISSKELVPLAAPSVLEVLCFGKKRKLQGMSLTVVLIVDYFSFQEHDLNFPFVSLLPLLHNLLVDCTTELLCANNTTWNLKISRQLFFNIAGVTSTHSRPFRRHFFCHGSVSTTNQGEDDFLVWQRRIRHVCRHFSVAVSKRILMYIHKS